MFNPRGVTKFSVDIDPLPNGSDKYYPGDSVTGSVNFTIVAVPIKLHHLFITMEGKASVKTNQPAEATLCNYISHLLIPSADDNGTTTSLPTDLDGRVAKKSLLPVGFLPVGVHSFPFSFNIPLDAPASVSLASTRGALEVKYLLKATLVRGEALTNNNTAKTLFHVGSVMSEEQHCLEKAHISEFTATLPMNALVGSNGVIEVKAKVQGRVVIKSSPKTTTTNSSTVATTTTSNNNDLPISIELEVDNCSKKAVEGATAELQLITQVDHYGNGYNSSHERYKQDREGDLRYSNKDKKLMPVPASSIKSEVQIRAGREEHENCGMGTALDGYVVKNNTALHFGSHSRTLGGRKLTLALNGKVGNTKLSAGSRGTFSATLPPEITSLAPLPTVRCDRVQINYRLLIRLGGVAKSICVPIVVVDEVISNQQQRDEGFQLPWFHHEKIFASVKEAEYKKEVPAPSSPSISQVAVVAAEEEEVSPPPQIEQTPTMVVMGTPLTPISSHQSQGKDNNNRKSEMNDQQQILDYYTRLGYASPESVADDVMAPPPAASYAAPAVVDHTSLVHRPAEMPRSCPRSSNSKEAKERRSTEDAQIAEYYSRLGYEFPTNNLIEERVEPVVELDTTHDQGRNASSSNVPAPPPAAAPAPAPVPAAAGVGQQQKITLRLEEKESAPSLEEQVALLFSNRAKALSSSNDNKSNTGGNRNNKNSISRITVVPIANPSVPSRALQQQVEDIFSNLRQQRQVEALFRQPREEDPTAADASTPAALPDLPPPSYSETMLQRASA